MRMRFGIIPPPAMDQTRQVVAALETAVRDGNVNEADALSLRLTGLMEDVVDLDDSDWMHLRAMDPWPLADYLVSPEGCAVVRQRGDGIWPQGALALLERAANTGQYVAQVPLAD